MPSSSRTALAVADPPQVQEIKLEYTHCGDAPTDSFGDMPSSAIQATFKNGSTNDIQPQWKREFKNVSLTTNLANNVVVETDVCHLRFNIPNEMKPPVLFYYHLTKFHQNHRRYVDSFDAQQLNGEARSYSDIDSSKCTPLKVNSTLHKPIFPCGLIANSLFNDTFTSPLWLNPTGSNSKAQVYEMNNSTDIAWASDKDLYAETAYSYEDVVPPPNWNKRYPNDYTKEDPPPNLKTWEAFQVWMRTASLPDFSKLYQHGNTTLEKGRYEVTINNRKQKQMTSQFINCR